MTLHRSWTRWALLLTVLALLATACRGSDQVATDDETPEATGEPTDEGTAAEEPTEEEPTEEGTPGEETPEATPAGDIAFDVGVTEEPCPDAVNEENGCIYLGTISDLTQGPFAALAVPITDAQAAFWRTVNENGGIGGFDINVSEYTRDNLYQAEVHSQVYEEIKGNILALAQTLGSPTTAAIIDDLRTQEIVAAPASWTSAWLFEDVIVESGAPYCIESMNLVDYALGEVDGVESVMAVHLPGDYGADGAAGAEVAADANGLEFSAFETGLTPEDQPAAVSEIIANDPDLVMLTTSPSNLATIVGQAVQQGFTGRFLASGPGFNEALVDSPAGPAINSQVFFGAYWGPYDADTPGHQAMRDALGDVQGNAGYVSGWAWSYPLRAALEQAAANGDLTRAGVLAAVEQLENVDYEGMLPESAGNFAGGPNEAAVRQSMVGVGNPDAAYKIDIVQDFFTGPTAEAFEFGDNPCFG